MKLLSLNLWGGRQGHALFDYLKQQAVNTDIFCFQEVFDFAEKKPPVDRARPNLLDELKRQLPDFNAYFEPAHQGWMDKHKVDFSVRSGQAIFVKKPLELEQAGRMFIYGDENTVIVQDFVNEPKILQFGQLGLPQGRLQIINVHGQWHPGDKLDTPGRLAQTEKILEFLQSQKFPQIVCGDFNLEPATQSIRLMEKNLQNLIKVYSITNTRNKPSWQHFGNVQHFADYTFVSPGVRVEKFEVPYNEVSDHLPMILEFGL